MTNRLVGEALEKRFTRHKVIKGVNLELPGGQIHTLMGKNGAGKTTLLRLLAGLLRPDHGTVHYIQNDVAMDARPHLGVVLHSSMLYPDLTVLENLHFFARLYQVTNVVENAERVLVLVGLQDRREQSVRTLSRGMTQRLAIARALIHEPSILLLDEPFSGLDDASGKTVETLLQEFRRNNGAVLFITHDYEVVARLADQMSLLENGKITSTLSVNGMSVEELRSAQGKTSSRRDE